MTMRCAATAALLVLVSSQVHAAGNLSLEEWLDIYVSSCVGGGSTFSASGSLEAGFGISLKKLGPNGKLVGQLQVSKTEYRLLSDGLSNAMSAVAAEQASQVRECLAPFRANLARAMSQQMGGLSPLAAPILFLSPHEERVMRVLAVHQGEDGQTGKNVRREIVRRETGISDIRLRVTIRTLQSKLLATDSTFSKLVTDQGPVHDLKFIEVISLWDKGEEYVLEMGYAK